jgi:hypothetical protein
VEVKARKVAQPRWEVGFQTGQLLVVGGNRFLPLGIPGLVGFFRVDVLQAEEPFRREVFH